MDHVGIQRDHQGNPVTLAASVVLLLVLVTVPASLAHSQTFTVLHTFTGSADGANPNAVSIDAAGNLYGGTLSGAQHTFYCQQYGCGTAYKLSHRGTGWILSTLHTFLGNVDGASPGVLTLATDGTLYGTAVADFSYTQVFRLRPQSNPCQAVQCEWGFTGLYRFNNQDNNGAYPTRGPLALDPAGNIYGVTQLGGNYSCNHGTASCGTVFELSQSGGVWSLNFIHLFSGTDGANPGSSSGVILDRFNNIYGTTTYGGPTRNYGTVFQLVPSGSGWTENLVYSFSHDNDDQGRYPFAGVILDSAGNLYGTNTTGGPLGGGTIFELSYSGGWNLSVLYPFTTNQGSTSSPLAFGPDGSLYGTVPYGGQNSRGAVFKLTQQGGSWIYTSLHDFTGQDDGAYPSGKLVFDSQGNIYGVAGSGGTYDDGVVFQITP